MLRLKCIFDKLSKHNGAAKKCFFQTFSPENFMKLDTDGRRKHTLYNCMGCLNNAKYNEAINKLQNVKPAKKNTPIIAKVTAMEELNKLNEVFSQSFSSIITNIPDSHMIMKPTKQEEEKKKIQTLRNATQYLEGQWNETDVERGLGIRQSFSIKE